MADKLLARSGCISIIKGIFVGFIIHMNIIHKNLWLNRVYQMMIKEKNVNDMGER